MKNCLTFILLTICIKGLPQSNDSLSRVLSNYEEFISRTGTIIKTEELLLGKVHQLQIKYFKSTDLSDNSFAESVYILGPGTTFWTFGGSLWIDKHELPGIIKAFEFYKAQIEKSKPANIESYYYSTKNRIVATSYYEPRAIIRGWYLSIYQRYKYIPDIIPEKKFELKEKDVDDIIEILKKSLEVKL
jgi:hypothetical protein